MAVLYVESTVKRIYKDIPLKSKVYIKMYFILKIDIGCC